MKKVSDDKRSCINVAIIENDPLRVAGFRALLEFQDDMIVTSMSPSELSGLADADVAILGKRHNYNLSAIMHQVRAIRPNLRVIVTALGGGDSAILDALGNGFKGYLDEAAPPEEFIHAIHVVNQGMVWAPRRVLALFIDRCSGSKHGGIGRQDFTKRERDVLEMLVAGRSNKEIAAPLGIEERTVKAHVAKLMRKVGVQNRIMLSIRAVSHCLVASR